MDVMMRAPAIHNGVYFVPVCYGCEPETAWRTGAMLIGRSSIVGPEGIYIADAGHYKGIAFASVDLDQPRVVHMWTREGEYVYRVDMLCDRRPDTYDCLTRPTPPLKPVKGVDLVDYPEQQDRLLDFIKKQDEGK